MMESCTVTGLEELKRNLMRLAKEATDAETDAAILGLGHEMKAKMQQRAHPALRSAIVAKPFSRKESSTLASAFVAIERKATNGNLAHLFEFGTSPRYRKKMKGRGGGLGSLIQVLTGKAGYTGTMPRRPFFRPVVDEYKGEKFLSRMAEIVRKRIERGR